MNPDSYRHPQPDLEPDDSASMSAARTAVLFGAGYLLWRGFVLLFGSAGVTGGLTAYQLDALRAGFEEVSDEWVAWQATTSRLSAAEVQVWGARVTVLFATDEETIEIFEHRAGFYRDAAANPALHSVCVSGAFASGRAVSRAMAGVVTDRVAYLSGRMYARESMGAAPWRPTLDLDDDDQVWDDFTDLLRARDMDYVVDIMIDIAEEARVEPASMCHLQADLYRLAVETPDHPISHATLAEFVRTFDAIGLEVGG